MTRTYSAYSVESVQAQLAALGLPSADLFARALVALLTGRKISLHHVTHLLPGQQNPEANRQQVRRCLDHETVTWQVWALAIAALLPRGGRVLALDRTEWKRGQITVNLLVLAVVTHGSAVPLLWAVMPACGASGTARRAQRVGPPLDRSVRQRAHPLPDRRQRIHRLRLGGLAAKGAVPFRIRIKAGEYLLHPDGRERRARDWFALRSCRYKPRKMDLWGLSVFVGGKHLHGNEYLIVISDAPGDLLRDYRLRWKIETLFRALKGRGFDLESCRLPQERRSSGRLGFLAMAFCRCLKVGRGLDEKEPLPVKKHGRRPVSTFQRGLRLLQSLLSCLAGRPRWEQFQQAVGELRPVKRRSSKRRPYS